MKVLKETINKCYEDCPYNQETFDGGSGCMMAGKDITKYEDNGFPYFCPLPDAEEGACEWMLLSKKECCGTCKHFKNKSECGKSYFKCLLIGDTNCTATDINKYNICDNYKTSCEYTIGQFSKADFKFCPYCGFPIKIKGQV